MMIQQCNLFHVGPWVPPRDVYDWLQRNHYLGGIDRGDAWVDDDGVIVFAAPTSRRLPQRTWLELSRWCLVGRRNGGSSQWARVRRALLVRYPHVTTIVSYSDPSHGHTGALYRACNWQWAPTWHRLRPPPTGNGQWTKGKSEAVKDRWVFPLRKDAKRSSFLTIEDESLRRRMPWANYPGDYKQFEVAV
jgi:hypothetical protein